MTSRIILELHSKRLSDFDLRRIAQAQNEEFDAPITAYLCGVAISNSAAVGVVFGHTRKGKYGQFDDGHVMRTSLIAAVRKEGRFWVVTTQNSRYVIATFQKGNGRNSLRRYHMVSSERQ
jgi:hypothetical protein